MNEDVLKGKWQEIQGDVKKTWGRFTDDEVMVIDGESEKLVGLLQTKYGYAKEKAQKELDDFIKSYKQY
ncbi:MAG: CsbD family protein [Synergistaceae bacterium]|nr:CsbD family protein [Synergistaceae bacterium]